MAIEFVLIGLLILANAFFAATEIALVASRPSRLQTLAEGGDHRATTVRNLLAKISESTAAVQVGVTLVGTLAAAVSGAGAVRQLAPLIASVPGLAGYAEGIAVGLVVVVLSYLQLIFGELMPKRLAIRNPERTAMALSAPFYFWTRLADVPSRLLAASTGLALRLIGVKPMSQPTTSQQEVESIVRQGAAEGVFEPAEHALIQGVFRFGDGTASDIMTPRTEMAAWEANRSVAEALSMAREAGFSRYPVYEGDLDQIVGMVHVKDLNRVSEEATLRGLVREVCIVPGAATLPKLFARLQKARTQLAVVLDEYGGTAGLVTLEDLLEEIVGEIEDEHSQPDVFLQWQADGKLLASGRAPADEAAETLGIPLDRPGVYKTLAGFVLHRLGRIPTAGDRFVFKGFVFTVSEMDRLRVAWVQIAPASPPDQPASHRVGKIVGLA
ncbi:MAG: hemolysin family protein [Anaerolineales bacterium]